MGGALNLRELERDSIRAFVQQAADDGYLSGRVLDYGCGKQPYRDIVEAAAGEYHGFDRVEFGGNVSGEDVGFKGGHPWIYPNNEWDAILCTQVLQYVPYYPHFKGIEDLLSTFSGSLIRGEGWKADRSTHGHLVLTYPTNWPEVEPWDLHRFTKAGMERLLTEAGFTIIRHERRAVVQAALYVPNGLLTSGEDFALGYGVIARA